MPIKVNCPICGNEMEVYPESKGSVQLYCSRPCRNDAKQARRLLSNMTEHEQIRLDYFVKQHSLENLVLWEQLVKFVRWSNGRV